MQCTVCSTKFLGASLPFGSDTFVCMKCSSCVGLSETETRAIQSKPQCLFCGLIFSGIQGRVCNACAAILDPIITSSGEPTRNSGTTTANVLQVASRYKQKASDTRLGHPTTLNPNLTKASRAKAVITERAIARKTYEAQGNIRIDVVIYRSSYLRGKELLTEIPTLRISKTFVPEQMTHHAVTELMEKLHHDVKRDYPDATLLTRRDITVFAHESAKKGHRLDNETISSGTVADLFEFFQSSKWVSKANIEKRAIELRFVFDEAKILFSNGGGGTSESCHLSHRSTAKRKLSLSPTLARSLPPPKRILQSAFRLRTAEIQTYSRNPPLTRFVFTPTIGEIDQGGQVVFRRSNDIDEIWIATDVRDELGRDKDSVIRHLPGFIGQGLTKTAIYGRYKKKEYAVVTVDHSDDIEEVRHLLRVEYGNLLMGQLFHERFKNLALDQNVTIPEFYFNTMGAILGELILDKNGGSSSFNPLAFSSFLATPLLPCDILAGKVQKFTGSDDIGTAPDKTNLLAMAIHAFSHYVLLDSKGQLVLTDLQGQDDAKGVMCLFDPQHHSAKSPESPDHVYWDLGPKHIEKFRKQHERICKSNIYCQRLELEYLTFDSDGESAESTPMTPRRHHRNPHNKGFPTP